MHLSVALEKYLLQLAADGRSGLTKAQYARHVRLLARWLESQGHTGEIEAIDQETLARFLSSPVARTRPDGTAKKATSMNVLRSTVRTFFAYAHRAGYIAHDPARLVRRAICEAPPARALGALAAAGEIDEREAHVTLLRAAEDCGLPRGEADRTIQSGWRAGMKQPRVPPGVGDLNMTFRKPPPPVEEATYDAAPWPAPMNGAAHIGLTGDFVGLVAPHSEADPAALLIQFLVTFGNVIGRGPYFVTEADRQTGNLFAVLVGTTSKGRKGTSWGYVKSVFGAVDPVWSDKCHLSGLASGEGLIWAVRDPIERKEPIKQRGRITDYQTVVADHGAADKRALFFEGELSSVLRVLAREGNTLSAMVRCAWDTGDLQTATKNSPAKATGAHISIVGHATKIELMRDLSQTESANGFGNRFLWICTRRSKLLPDGGAVPGDQLLALAKRLEDLLPFAREERRLRRDEEAKELWHRVYPELSEGKPGLMGAMVARAEAQVTRLSLLYALLDQSSVIRAPHLRAALEVWRYSEASARFVFGNALGTRWPTRSSEP